MLYVVDITMYVHNEIAHMDGCLEVSIAIWHLVYSCVCMYMLVVHGATPSLVLYTVLYG